MVLAVGDEPFDGFAVGRVRVHDPVGDPAGDDHGLDRRQTPRLASGHDAGIFSGTATGGSGWRPPPGSLLRCGPTAWVRSEEVVTASSFSMVDESAEPKTLVGVLDHIAAAETGMKHYAAAALRQHSPGGRILDIGCGTGHDLAILRAMRLRAVGVDTSAVMLKESRNRTLLNRLVRADGQWLPFADGSFDGCRIERVLMHVEDPEQVVREAVRCIREGGMLTMFEPDWSSLMVNTDEGEKPGGWLSSARHPEVGGRLWELAEAAGCDVLDRVEELSVWRNLEPFENLPGGCREAARRAVEAGRTGRQEAERWLEEQMTRAERGAFQATIKKTLIVSKKPG